MILACAVIDASLSPDALFTEVHLKGFVDSVALKLNVD